MTAGTADTTHSRLRRHWFSKIILTYCIAFLFTPPVFAQQGFAPIKTVQRDYQGDAPRQDAPLGANAAPGELPFGSRVSEVKNDFGLSYQIHVVGEVASSGTYSIPASTRLQSALQSAGGVRESGSMRNVQVRRGATTRTYDLFIFQMKGNLSQNPYLMDNDVVYVPLRKNVIQMVGSVHRPQMYELKNERTVADAVALAGGLTVGVQHGVSLRIIRFVDGQKNVLKISTDPEEMARTDIQNGDVIFVPNVFSGRHKFDYNIGELPGDHTFYPSAENRVFVLGGVNTPGPHPFTPYGSVSQYLTLSGGLTLLAKHNRLQLIRSDGSVEHVKYSNMQNVRVDPGDTIYVPPRRLAPETWISLITGLVSFGFATLSSVLYVKSR